MIEYNENRSILLKNPIKELGWWWKIKPHQVTGAHNNMTVVSRDEKDLQTEA